MMMMMMPLGYVIEKSHGFKGKERKTVITINYISPSEIGKLSSTRTTRDLTVSNLNTSLFLQKLIINQINFNQKLPNDHRRRSKNFNTHFFRIHRDYRC